MPTLLANVVLFLAFLQDDYDVLDTQLSERLQLFSCTILSPV